MQDVFDKIDSDEIIARINKLETNSKGLWGKMSVDKMLAHCNVTYEMVYSTIHKKPSFIMRLILKAFVKNKVVSEELYAKNQRTAPMFIISKEKDFEKEKLRLIEYIEKTQSFGGDYFDGKESHSFGSLTTSEWNNMFYKHLDHHLKQFGV